MEPGDLRELTLSISAVERDTGLSKDTLRMWERRYGFPEPLRDANGERVYPVKQVERLRLIKRLMDRGHRPGKIMAQTLEQLLELGRLPDNAPRAHDDMGIFLNLIRTHQLDELRRRLARAQVKQGLQRLILDIIAPLTTAVGESWMRGELAVFEEHLYTEQMQSLLRNAVSPLDQDGRAPRVLLTSFPNEPHSLGLLMVEALLTLEGAACVPLGTETPLPDIAHAVQAHMIDIVALSFSAAFGDKHAAAGLGELRAMLPAGVEIWAGGASIVRLRKEVPGVALLKELSNLSGAVASWRQSRSSSRQRAQ
jgi:DNA-binding transcriptional MerR regulator/methylmalonyl-CoA mutase cobalamin-binding subunit